MHVVVLGAGVVGLTTAYYLRQAGHRVTVLERGSGPAEGARRANAGGLCPGFSGPWASPTVLRKATGWLLRKNAPLGFGRGIERADLPWLANFLLNCRRPAFVRNKARMQRLAHYSQDRLLALNQALAWGDNYDFRRAGVLQLFRDAGELAALEKGALRVLRQAGIDHRLLGAVELTEIEPALRNSAARFAGGLYLPGDASGDSHKFSTALADWLVRNGVDLRFAQEAGGLEITGNRLRSVLTPSGHVAGDAFVVALGAEAGALLRPLGLNLPIRPVKGYSLTARLRDPAAVAPNVALMDEQNKTFIARLGDRIRIAGMAEIGGFDLSLPETRRQFLQERLAEIYPSLVDFSQADFWAGLRPMTWDGPPILGPTPVDGLFLNAGHGSSGWTQACGTGQIVADLVSGKLPAIALDGLTLSRFTH